MLNHSNRTQYFIVGEGEVETPAFSHCPLHAPLASPANAIAPASQPKNRFGWMFGKSAHTYAPKEQEYVMSKLTDLGTLMNQTAASDPDQSQIPSGYTYLGQFIAHEITFDQTKGFLANGAIPDNDRSPQIELDSLYGGEPEVNPKLYQDYARLKVGETFLKTRDLNHTFPNDLPRNSENKENPTEALIGDPRNDENLPVAQTHVAFIKFHNEVVNRLEKAGCAKDKVFACARKEVVRHFHWIILNDFLPRILDQDVLIYVLGHDIEWCKGKTKEDLFMPLEFSVAAYRFGHSMVRSRYEWNSYHTSRKPINSPAKLGELFEQTSFSSNLGGSPRLQSDWVIDWRRFYDFRDFPVHPVRETDFNFSRRIDTVFDLHLDKIANFPHEGLKENQLALTTRNLLRGFTLSLPTGEEVAERLGETPLTHKQITSGPYGVESATHKALLDDPVFDGRTPLWYYILKEAELNEGNRLGKVGSRIVAETLVGLIRNSRYSISDDPQWRPQFGWPAEAPERFDMVDLLTVADVVDPIGKLQGYRPD